jgi:hypothetical protein
MRTTFNRVLIVLILGVAVAACGEETTDTTAAGDPGTTAAPDTTAPAGASPLVGQWERAQSTYTSLDGMIVEVQDDGATAVILTVPENEYQFVSGDVKWSDIVESGENEWTFQDLVREENTGSTSHVGGVIVYDPESDTITMSFDTGTEQEWVRVEGS